MGEIELKPEQIAYAALWWLIPSSRTLNDARIQLLEMIGGEGSEGSIDAIR